MNTYKNIAFFWLLSLVPLMAQNQLPIPNGEFESVSNNEFTQWTNQANNGGSANFSIETTNLIPQSTKALKSEILSLGAESYHVKTKSDYGFQVVAGEKYTVSFYAKIEGAPSRQMKLVFQSETAGSFQGQDFWITESWQRFTHTFTVPVSGNENKIAFWYLQSDVTYFLDEVTVVPGEFVTMDVNTTFQTVEGFGAGIKRRTEDLYALDDDLRAQIEAYCFQDLEVNMIRFFVYHDLEPTNDNNNPFDLDETQLDWTRYDSDPSNWRSRYVGEALNNAFSLSTNGFDHIIGNCNSAPGWLKTNGQHNNGGTLIPGGEAEYSEFLIAFLNGMQSRYNISVTAISPTNEPDYMVGYESMNTTPSQLSSIISNLNTRLTNAGLEDVDILSPECFTVSSNNADRSATNYINTMFASPVVKNAVDIVATHTYADPNHNANWAGLKTAASDKSVWVTESAVLNGTDESMTDAANYIKWILRGFNEGGMTAYMMHLFYEETDPNGYSSLVSWTHSGEIILAKRYYTFKHFANLVKKGYQLISSETINDNIMVGAFKSPDGLEVVLQVFNEGDATTMSLEVPNGTTMISHYMTSDDTADGFNPLNDISYTEGDPYIETNLPALSFHSFVYSIDETLSNTDFETIVINEVNHKLFPNPTEGNITLQFSKLGTYDITVYNLDGAKIVNKQTLDTLQSSLDVSSLSSGLYFIKIASKDNQHTYTLKFLKR